LAPTVDVITVDTSCQLGVVEMGDKFVEPPPDGVPEPPPRPAWMGPPAATFSGLIPLQRTIARSDQAMIVLRDIAVYAQGCVLALNVAVRVGDQLPGAATNRFRKRVTQRYISDPGVVRVSPVSSQVFRPERIIGQPP
jgi:hypothetical protein